MTARKKTPAPKPVTVAELLLALASYPQDAPVELQVGGWGALSVDVAGEIDEERRLLWEPYPGDGTESRPQHYRRPEVGPTIVTRPADGRDEFVTVKEFLEWLREQRYGMPKVSTGGGHNEMTTYRDLGVSELAEEYATRSTT